MPTNAITMFKCPDGHCVLVRHDVCPRCGGSLREESESPAATLLSYTHLHVSPTGKSFVLGIAMTASGAKTLCHVHGTPADDRESEVTLSLRDNLYLATVVDDPAS